MRLRLQQHRRKGTHWSGKELRILKALWERRLQGERTEDLAAEIDLKAGALRRQWAKMGLSLQEVRSQEVDVSGRDSEVYRMRLVEGLTLAECCVRLGLEPTKANQHRIRATAAKYAQQNELPALRRSTEDRDAKVYEWRREGLSFDACAARLGLPVEPKTRNLLCTNLRNYCERHGLPYPGRSTEERDAQVYTWRQEGLSFDACAERLGLPVEPKTRRALSNGLARYCKRNGLTRPGRKTCGT